MERIASFCVDHLKLQRGIYLSRRDVVGNEVITSFDIRMKAPYREPVLGGAEIHTMEHLAATWLRNSDWKDKIMASGIADELHVGSQKSGIAVNNAVKDEAVAALTMLGFSPAPVAKVVVAILQKQADMPVEQVVKEALKQLK